MERRCFKQNEDNMEREKNILLNNGSCLDTKFDSKHVESKILDFTISGTTCLNLSSCSLFECPSKFCSLDNITELNLSSNKLNTLPNEFANLKKLRILDISRNLFNELPPSLFTGLHLIKFLNASSNKIEVINKPPLCLPMLQHLDLSSNQLYEPPHWLLNCLPTSLEIIDLSNNPCFQSHFEKINTLEEKVAENVKTLKLANCRLREGNELYIQNYSNLKNLEIGNNLKCKSYINYVTDLKTLPDSLEKLSLPNIGLAVVATSITSLTQLRILDISGNMVHWLPASIQNLQALLILRAESCNLCLLPPEMNNLLHLKELYLSSNQLSSPEGFENLNSLEVLDLYENQFISVPNLNQFSKLVAVDLSQNYVEPPEIIEINCDKHNYEDLQNHLRAKFSIHVKRKSGAKEFPTIPDDEANEEFSDCTSEELDMEETEFDNDVEQNRERGNLDEDSWEEDENETFDPNDASTLTDSLHVQRIVNCQNLTGETPYEVTIHPHFFTPFRLIAPVKVLDKKSFPPPVEGQFDD